MRVREKSALVYILKAFIPYSRANLALSFRPNQFFNELEQISGYKRKTLEETTRRARHRGLIEKKVDTLRLTELGQKTIRPFVAERIKDNGRLMIIFDVPEDKANSRAQLRSLLRKWGFKQVQKSVWLTSYDQKAAVEEAVKELGLSGAVQLYECALLFPLPKKTIISNFNEYTHTNHPIG